MLDLATHFEGICASEDGTGAAHTTNAGDVNNAACLAGKAVVKDVRGSAMVQAMKKAAAAAKDAVTLSTVHGSKGREWDHVILFRASQGGSDGIPIFAADRERTCVGGACGCPRRPDKGGPSQGSGKSGESGGAGGDASMGRGGFFEAGDGEVEVVEEEEALMGPTASTPTLLFATAQNRDSRQCCLEEERRLFYVAASRPRHSLTIVWPRKDRAAGQDFTRSIFCADITAAEQWELAHPREVATKSERAPPTAALPLKE